MRPKQFKHRKALKRQFQSVRSPEPPQCKSKMVPYEYRPELAFALECCLWPKHGRATPVVGRGTSELLSNISKSGKSARLGSVDGVNLKRQQADVSVQLVASLKEFTSNDDVYGATLHPAQSLLTATSEPFSHSVLFGKSKKRQSMDSIFAESHSMISSEVINVQRHAPSLAGYFVSSSIKSTYSRPPTMNQHVHQIPISPRGKSNQPFIRLQELDEEA
ncbi:hypothetical protein HOY82DRAFT_604853 [Tuber indicum]|nr:hypothetical protein HOY82DRAFT_604853 [Tuber indicum]